MGESSHAILGSDLVGSRPRRVLLRLQRDERLVALIRSGDDRAFEVLFNRHRVRLLGFCRGMLGDVDDAEDVMQEVFAAAHAAMLADQRDLAVRPWLYRIARNRCLNHLRGVRALSSDKLDGHPHGNGASTQDRAETRDELRALLESVKDLPETQRGALLLRELDDLSYDEIARAMGTTMPAVKSLLVRARVTLAEASRARELTCAEVRLQLAEAAEGMRRTAGEVRHHVRHCPHCEAYRRHLRSTRRGLGALALAPLGILAALQRLLGLGGSGGAAASGGATASGGAAASGTAVSLAAGGIGLTGSKLVATAAVATLVGAGAGEITKGSEPDARPRPAPTQNAALAPAAAPEPVSVAPAPAVTAPAHPPATPTRPDDDRADPATRAPDPSKTDAPDAPPAPPRRTPVDEAPVPEEPPSPAAEEPAPPSTDPLEGTGDESLATPTTPPRADYGDDPDTILNPDPLPTPDEPPAPPTPSPPPDVSPPKPPTGTPRAPTTDREGAAPAADCAIAGGCPVP